MDVVVRATGGEIRVPLPDSARGSELTRSTPFVVEAHGPVRELVVRSHPAQPVRVRILLPSSAIGGVAPGVHRGWSFRFRRDGGRFVPVVQGLPVPPR